MQVLVRALGTFALACLWPTHTRTDTVPSTRVQELFTQGIEATRQGNVEKALAAYNQILHNHPNQIQALYNRGYALKMAGRVDEAITYYKKVLALDPAYEPAIFALGHAYLYNGDFENGWKHHERHIRAEHKASDNFWNLVQENNLNGKKILLIPEGGLGDTIHFIRYAHTLHTLGAHITCLVQKPLYNILAHCTYIDKLITDPKHVGPYDAKASYMSLPALFHSTEETIPRIIPYLTPDPALIQHWQKIVASDNKIKIGICWQADVFNDSSRFPVAQRGIPLAKLFPLGLIENIRFFSLQKKEGLEQLNNIPTYFNFTIFDPTFDEAHGSFMDSAAVIANLDLVITIDSAIAHLAGALGKPVWLLLPYATDWRWIAHRTDSPWYPTMRIFQQPEPFDWDSVIQDVLHALITTFPHA